MTKLMLIILWCPMVALGSTLVANSSSIGSVEFPGFKYYAIHFDGSSYLTNNSVSVTNSGQGTFSIWFKVGTTSVKALWGNDNDAVSCRVNQTGYGTNSIYCSLFSDTWVSSVRFHTAPTYDMDWHHVLCSWNSDAGSESILRYVDGVPETTATFTNASSSLNYEYGAWGIGVEPFGRTLKYIGDMCEFYLATEFIDISVAGNRLKFRTAAGKPANLGPNGSLPTGNVPFIYLRNPAATFGNNLGYGGNFDVTGTLTDTTGP